jgi:opacity protein-like surface antigen
MFRAIFLIFLLPIHCVTFAQPAESKGYFGIAAGVSVPVSNFGSTDTNDLEAGYARPGFTGYILPQIQFNESIGFAGLLGYTSNAYNTAELENQYRANHPSQQYTFSAGSYEMINMLGGVSFTIPQGSIDLTLKAYIGLGVAVLPATKSMYTPVQAGDPILQLQTEKNRATALSYGGGVNLLFYVSEKLGITLDAVYLYSNPEFNAVEISVYEDGELTVLSGIDMKQKFQLINVGAGIAFLF